MTPQSRHPTGADADSTTTCSAFLAEGHFTAMNVEAIEISEEITTGAVGRSRGASETDGRAVTLSLTAHGQELAQQAREARQPLLTEWAERYGSRLAQTSGLLRSLRQELRQPFPEGS